MSNAPQFLIYQGVKTSLKNPKRKTAQMETTTFSQKSKKLLLLGCSIPRTELSDILEISIELHDRFPEILEMIEADHTAHIARRDLFSYLKASLKAQRQLV